MKIIGQIKAILSLDKSRFDQGLNQAEKKTNSFGNAMKKIGGILAAAFSIAAIGSFIAACREAYLVQKEAEIKLATILKQRMGLGDEAIKSLQKQASEYQKIGVISDEIQLSGLQQLATFLHQKESLETLLPAMNNLLAQQRGIKATAQDAVGIANMMGKVLDGQVASLRRVGISFTKVQENALKTGNEFKRASMLAQVITDNVGNMNVELGKTNLGKLAKFKNTLGDLKEVWGEWLTVSPVVNAIRSYFTDILKVWADESKSFAEKAVSIMPGGKGLIKKEAAWEEKQRNKYPAIYGFKIIKPPVIKAPKDIPKEIETINILNQRLEDYKDELYETDITETAAIKTKKDLIKTLQKQIDLLTNLSDVITRAKPITPITGLPVPNIVGIPALPGIQTGVQTLEEATQYQVDKLTGKLEEQQVAVDILSNAFDTLFTSTEDGFKAMIDSIITSINRLIAELLARVVVLSILNSLTGGAASFGTVLKAAFGFGGGGIPIGQGVKGASGLTVPSGYPHDTFPTMLSSGETVLTAEQSRNFNRSININVKGEISGRAIALVGRRTEREN